MYTFFRIIKFGFQNFLRNFWLSLATLSIICITLLLVNIVIGLNVIKNESLKLLEQQINVSLDFKANTTRSEVLQVQADLKKDSRVADATVITPDENLAEFKRRRPDITDKVLPVLTSNPLGYSIRVKANLLEDYTGILDDIQKNEKLSAAIDNANFVDYRILTDKASSFSDKLNFVTFILIIVFFCIALIIIYNTIRMSIYNHRDEIGIMKLVGATNWFIRMPFFVESFIYAFISVGLIALILNAGLQLVTPYAGSYADLVRQIDLSGYYQKNFVTLFGAQFIAVIVTTITSASFAMRRYLRI